MADAIEQANALLRERGYAERDLAVHTGPRGKALLKGNKILSPLSDEAEVVLRVDRGPAPDRSRVVEFSGAGTVAGQALGFARLAPFTQPAVVNGGPGLITVIEGGVYSVQGFTVHHRRIVEIDLYADRERLRSLELGGAPR